MKRVTHIAFCVVTVTTLIFVGGTAGATETALQSLPAVNLENASTAQVIPESITNINELQVKSDSIAEGNKTLLNWFEAKPAEAILLSDSQMIPVDNNELEEPHSASDVSSQPDNSQSIPVTSGQPDTQIISENANLPDETQSSSEDILKQDDQPNTPAENEQETEIAANTEKPVEPVEVRHSEIITTREVIPFNTRTVDTTELQAGVEDVASEGEPGEKSLTIRIDMVNGEEKSREVIEETVIKEPVDRVIRKGTSGVLQVGDTAYEYTRELTMNASAYTADYESTGKNPGDPGYGITASGEQVRHGIVSVDPSVISLGTRLYVEGYGESLAADTGSAIKGHKIDLFYEKLSDAYNFGRRNLKVYVLK